MRGRKKIVVFGLVAMLLLLTAPAFTQAAVFLPRTLGRVPTSSYKQAPDIPVFRVVKSPSRLIIALVRGDQGNESGPPVAILVPEYPILDPEPLPPPPAEETPLPEDPIPYPEPLPPEGNESDPPTEIPNPEDPGPQPPDPPPPQGNESDPPTAILVPPELQPPNPFPGNDSGGELATCLAPGPPEPPVNGRSTGVEIGSAGYKGDETAVVVIETTGNDSGGELATCLAPGPPEPPVNQGSAIGITEH